MTKIPFDIKHRDKIESGEYKVETKDGRQVRIVCWDVKNSYSKAHDDILALVKSKSEAENALFYAQNGYCLSDSSRVGRKDLFIVTPEPELSEFERAITKYRPQSDSQETIQRIAAELLTLAKEECKSQIESDFREIIHGAYKKGRADALKDLPRWRAGSIKGDRIVGLALYHDLKWIPFSELEKLPGFNDEDHE